jgi:hypothetical protein
VNHGVWGFDLSVVIRGANFCRVRLPCGVFRVTGDGKVIDPCLAGEGGLGEGHGKENGL